MVHHERVLAQHSQFLAGSVQGWPRQVLRQDLVVQFPRDPTIFPVPVHQPAVRRSPGPRAFPVSPCKHLTKASFPRARASTRTTAIGYSSEATAGPALKMSRASRSRRRIKPDHPDTKAARSTATSSTVVLPEPCPCAQKESPADATRQGSQKFLAITYSRPEGLPSAGTGLASVFGMGTGVSPPVKSPGNSYIRPPPDDFKSHTCQLNLGYQRTILGRSICGCVSMSNSWRLDQAIDD